MPRHSRSRFSLRLVASGAALVVALPLGAQESRVIIGGGHGASVVTLSSLALSDTAVRRLIETHLPDSFSDGADAHHVLIVLDANGEYVSGNVKKAAVINPATIVNGENVLTGDSLGAVARVMVRRLENGTAAEVIPGGAVTVIRRNPDGGGSSQFNVMGSNYSMSEISSIGTRRYNAGELAQGPVIVSIIRLK